MRALVLLAVALQLASPLWADAPVYSADSIVNAASNQPGALAPNTIATLYGKNLAQGTATLKLDKSGLLPTVLPGTGVRIVIGSVLVNPLYVSPTQITFLVPPNLSAGNPKLVLTFNSRVGPTIPLQLVDASPALFQLDWQNALALGASGAVITPDAPAQPGDLIVLYATGLGRTAPPVGYCELPTETAILERIADFTVVLDGVPVDSRSIGYAGIVPDSPGLYQIDVILPLTTGDNPQIQIGFQDSLSPAGVSLPVRR